MSMVPDELKALSDSLLEQRALLIAGRFEDAIQVMDSQRSLVDWIEAQALADDRLQDAALRRDEIDKIKSQAQENAILIKAVENGVRSAVRRLKSAGEHVHVGAYDQSGGQTAFPQASGGYRKSV